MSDALEPCMPNPKIRVLNDGSIQISIGDVSGTVSSHQFIELKLRQLRLLWELNSDNLLR